MSVVGSLDAIAVKAEAVTGIKRVYSVGVSASVRPIPRGIDDGPVGTVWIGSGDMQGGNAEHVSMSPTLDIWVRADDAGYANKTLAQFIDPMRDAFRLDMDLGGECSRCHMTGWDEPETQEVNGNPYLILPIRLDVLVTRYASDATA